MKPYRLLPAAVALAWVALSHAAVPLMTSYQGRVKVNGADFTGTGHFKFVLVASPGGASLWSNDGTSVNASEPAAAVALPVKQGLFTVLLGDATLPNMRPLRAEIFTANPQVSLRVWFDDGVNGSVQLRPDTVLGAVPYAMAATVPEGSITGTHLAPGSIRPDKLASANAPAAGRVLTYDGAQFNWADPGIAGRVWSVLDGSAYYNGGSVGIGTDRPQHRLSLQGGPTWTDNGWVGALSFENGAAIGWEANAEGQRFGMGHTGAGFFMFRTENDPGTTGKPAQYDFSINDAGNVGVGTWIPESKLHVAGDVRYDGALSKLDVADNFAAVVRAGDLLLGHSSRRGEPGRALVDYYPALHLNFGDWPETIIGGRVGIGTLNPDATLHAEATGRNAVIHGKATGSNTGVFGESTSTVAGTAAVYGRNLAGFAMAAEGNVTQNRDKGGWVKAMVVLRSDGSISRCFNSFLPGDSASSTDCGFSSRLDDHEDYPSYTIDFGFRVNDRFILVTPFSNLWNLGANWSWTTRSSEIRVSLFVSGEDLDKTRAPFVVIVF